MNLDRLFSIAQILKNQDTKELFFGASLETEDFMNLFHKVRKEGENSHVQIIATTTVENNRVLVLDVDGIEVILREKRAPIGEIVQFSQN